MRWQVAAGAMGALVLGTVTVGAAGIILWNPKVAERFEASERQQKDLEEKKVSVPAEASATENGVTVSLEQSLLTERYMYLYFEVTAPEGMKLGQDTFFEESSLLVNGRAIDANYSGGLANPSEDGEDNVTSWEWFVQWHEKQEMGGQEMTAHFENLNRIDKTGQDEELLAEGTWDVTWTLEYEPSEETFQIGQALTEDVAVTSATISPISIEVTYDWPKRIEEIWAEDANGENVKTSQYAELPIYASHYRMRDGSKEEIGMGGAGYAGYLSDDEEDAAYVESFGCTKVFTVEDIAGIIFTDRDTGQEYEVPLRRKE